MTRRWGLSHSKAVPFSVAVWDQPAWTLAVESFVGKFCSVVLRDRWCAPPEWTFKIPLGWPRRDEDGDIDNSLGSALYRSFQHLASVGHKRETVHVYVPVSRAMAEQIDPEAVAEFVDLFDLDDPPQPTFTVNTASTFTGSTPITSTFTAPEATP